MTALELSLHREDNRPTADNRSASAGDSLPLVVLHGLFGSWENWGRHIKALSNEREVVGMDLRNHGDSPHADQMNYDLMADDVLHTLDAHNIEVCQLLGHSMGGKTAMAVASRAPERVERLISVDIAPRQYNPHHLQILEAMNTLDLTNVRSRRDADAHLQSWIPESMVRAFLLKSLSRQEDGSYQWQLGLDTITSDYPRLLESPPRDTRYAGPVLMLYGDQSDYVIPERDLPLLQEWFTDFRCEAVAGGGHWLHATHPEPTQQAITAFLH